MSSDRLLFIPDDLVWLEPWVPVNHSGEALVRELRRELPEQHVLFGVPVAAVARREDCDDVLLATADPSKPLAVVHLTWSGRAEPGPRWPHTTTYKGWKDWIDRCMVPDHKERSEHA